MIINTHINYAEEKEFWKIKEQLEKEGWKMIDMEYVETTKEEMHVSSIFFRTM